MMQISGFSSGFFLNPRDTYAYTESILPMYAALAYIGSNLSNVNT